LYAAGRWKAAGEKAGRDDKWLEWLELEGRKKVGEVCERGREGFRGWLGRRAQSGVVRFSLYAAWRVEEIEVPLPTA
jgi:hypothetical protein